MDICITPAKLSGTIGAIPSKSDLHRALICAALADRPTEIVLSSGCVLAEDIQATIHCLEALGAVIRLRPDQAAAKTGTCLMVPGNPDREKKVISLLVEPVGKIPDKVYFDCGESGSTLRFLIPVASALCKQAIFSGSGRLPERPLAPLPEILRPHGCTFSSDRLPFVITGCPSDETERDPEFILPGNISSQFISGLLLAAPLFKGIRIRLTTPAVSASYITMTINTMKRFGVTVEQTDRGFRVPDCSARYRTPRRYEVDGGWSSASFFIAADVLSDNSVPLSNQAICSGHSVSVTGLRPGSAQGDKIIRKYAEVFRNRRLSADSAPLIIDADSIPDLVPPLAVLASLTPGTTRIINAGRLRLKESDRLLATSEMLLALGADVRTVENELHIEGKNRLRGGTVNGYRDHRIVMSAAIASIGCTSSVTVTDAEATAKSYPSFWDDFTSLGGRITQANA